MKRMTVILLSIFCLLSAFSTKKNLHYSGTASDLQSGAFYYTEEHEEWQSGSLVTETKIKFRDDHNNIIVAKRIDYSKDNFKPDFVQEDHRDGYMEGATSLGEWTTLKYRKNSRREIETKTVKIPEPAVIDGGFTYFIKAHWNELINGQRIVFHFAVPSQLDYYTFRVFKSEEQNRAGKKVVIFKMEPDQFILRKLLPPILLHYNSESKRLMQFEGLSTINDSKGKSYRVRIVYPVTGP